MHPVFKRPATNSPRSPSSEMSPSNPASKRFKTPMMFQPTVAPSPSRRELWKQELGLDGSESDEDPTELSSDDDQPESDQQANHAKGRHSNVEFDALELELERKEKQKDALLIKLKESADKVSSYKAELERSQQAKRNQLKIMKKTYETHLSEKEECIQCLHELIEEQGNKIIDLHAKSIGESSTDDDDGVNSFRAVKKLVDKLSAAQQEKAHLTATVMKSQARMTKLEDEKEEINNKFEENKQALEKQIKKLEKELEEIKNSGQCVVSSKEDKTVIESLEQEKVMLSKEISKMENELADHKRKNLEWENRFETEVSKLRSIMKQTEEQLNKVTEAEPKVIVKTVISEETKKQVESLEVLNHDLKEKLAVAEEKLSLKTTSFEEIKLKLTSEKESLSASIAEKSSEIEKLGRKLAGLLKFENLFEESQRQVSSLEAELKTTLDSLSKTKHESKIKIEDLSQEMETRVKKAKLEAETKYATVIRQFNDLKKNSFELANSLAMIKQEYVSLKYEMKSLASSIHPAMLATQKAITTAIADIDDNNKILVEKYKKEMRLRKKYHNEVVELKGNIRVFCRVRPRIKEDGDGINGENVVSFDDFDDGILTVEHKGKMKEFEVDRVFRPTSTQVEVFNEVESLVTSCIDGYNVCIFAYGQTGSGKTFTMEGTLEDPGINQRALSLLFKEISERNDWSYRISVCMMEIYNESLRDLLATKNHEGSLDIKQSKDTVFVPGLNEVEVTNASEVNNVFALGHKNRKTASTNMNEHSSRSHAILVINITGENKNTGTKTTGKLNLVDLAGSERVSKSGAEGARMKEAQNINKSLSALGDVIHSLKNKNSHIPYRNTKLTYLLQDSLGGDSKTLMVVQVAPVRKNEGETYCSLDFAQRVKSVELGQATKKIEMADRFNESLGTPKSRTPKKRT